MKILAIDTSCDESCAAILETEGNRLLADIVHSHVASMVSFGGIVPEIASREHLRALPLVVKQACDTAGCSLDEIDWIAVTNRPGLIGALLVGVTFAKSLAFALGRPFCTLDHLEAHLFSPMLCAVEGQTPPAFPWLGLVVSGGHTELFHVRGPLDYRWLGGTLDDAAGEAFDKIGKLLSYPYPAGPQIDRAAKTVDQTPFQFPRAKVDGFHFSYSGLKTAVGNAIKKQGALTPNTTAQVAKAAQEAILDQLVDKIEKAQQELSLSQVVITGGVACNSRLRERLPGAHFPAPQHCADNAAMVAWLANLYHQTGRLTAAAWSESASPRSQIFSSL